MGVVVDRDLAGNSATYSGGSLYRYRLERRLPSGKGTLGVVMLNPSTAGAFEDDPTIRRLKRWASRWGYGRILVGNLYAFRSPDPSLLEQVDRAEGKDNRAHLLEIVRESNAVLCAWGAHPAAARQIPCFREVVEAARAEGWRGELVCLRLTGSGAPVHPMARGRGRVPDSAVPKPFELLEGSS